jgi:hypothetical protein
MMRGGVRGPDMADVFGTGAGQYGNGFASQKCGGAKVTIRSLLLCGDRDIDIHRLRDWHGLAIASGPAGVETREALCRDFAQEWFRNGRAYQMYHSLSRRGSEDEVEQSSGRPCR